MMSRNVTGVEVKNAMFNIGGLKAPGADGFPSLFYQKHWNICASEITQMVTLAFQCGKIPMGLNHTLIALVPKVSSPQDMALFRPISLCKTLYKVISKVLVARIRPYLRNLISPNQVSFVPGRHISDNIVIVQEVLQKYQHSHGGKGFMAWKIDLSKAYDRLNWGFIETVLVEAQFPTSIVKLIMENLLRHFESVGGLDKVIPYHPIYLSYDLILFADASCEQARILKRCLDVFCDISSQESRLAGWKSKMLNLSGRLTLIQAVTNSIPVYTMQLPVSICDALDKCNRDFLWGDCNGKKKIHLANWDLVCRPKEFGGLGIKKASMMNQAMLVKIGWRMVQEDQGLWRNVLNKKYVKSVPLLNPLYACPSGCSRTWRSIIFGVSLLKQGLSWRIGDGSSGNFWNDRWLPDGPLVQFLPDVSDIDLQMQIPPGFMGSGPDKLIWGGTANGHFTMSLSFTSLETAQVLMCYESLECCWYIWKWRNKAIFDGEFHVPFNPCKIIIDATKEWTTANTSGLTFAQRTTVSLHWEKPPMNWIKLNVDGARNHAGMISAGGLLLILVA
ncbi:uncharacterized protein LOC133744775 [Rosa rugosa]|uniref:uncharacterized protein LOC133744775 n=1 Tax=Rosa rugosa TaxID=74645 RepID=UPI002B411A56|nr:uncharacterized protein LOC133744775 [Rosa rugosa]